MTKFSELTIDLFFLKPCEARQELFQELLATLKHTDGLLLLLDGGDELLPEGEAVTGQGEDHLPAELVPGDEDGNQ